MDEDESLAEDGPEVEGRHAHLDGLPKTANPYSNGSFEALLWDGAWQEAEDEPLIFSQS